MPEYYGSPRWSQEITDCSMPMTFDTYSVCSYDCQYCFSAYQKGVGPGKQSYFGKDVRAVNVECVKRMFTEPESSQFGPFIRLRRPMQWGGLADPFDEYERRLGHSLELLRFFRQIEYPICFSTKATWWVWDERYRECFDGFPWFNVKFSIITLDENKARSVEKGCPSSAERLSAMGEAAKWVGGGVTLRLRPFIIGMSDPHHVALIQQAAQQGATALSTEFFCLEMRSRSGLEERYPVISRACGFDVVAFYKKYSYGSGYLRLNRNVKRPFVDEMEAACADAGMRFYVSDAHFKERCANGSCCGLSPEWNYTRGQDCEALMIARQRGRVRWADIAADLEYAKTFRWRQASGYNLISSEKRAAFNGHSMYDYLRYVWNHPNVGQSPYRMFEGIIKPIGLDADGDIIYEWDESRA